jgi:spermidine/putrescine transport system permease protein
MSDATHALDAGATQTGATAAEAAERRAVRARWLLNAPALLIIGGVGIMPLTIIALYSLLEPADYAGVIWKFSAEAWFNLILERDMFDGTVGISDAHLTIYARSILQALFTTGLTLLFGFPTAYFIATRNERERNIWLFLITIPFWTNLLIRTFAIMLIVRDQGLINQALIGLGIIDKPIAILYTDFAVSMGLVYAYLPFMVLPLYASMEKLDFRLVEAGYDLYASRWRVLRRIIVPLVKPGIVAGCILVFIPAIGAYVTPRLLGGGKNMMLGNLIANQFGTSRDWPLGSAMALALMGFVMIALVIYVRNVTAKGRANG